MQETAFHSCLVFCDAACFLSTSGVAFWLHCERMERSYVLNSCKKMFERLTVKERRCNFAE